MGSPSLKGGKATLVLALIELAIAGGEEVAGVGFKNDVDGARGRL